MLIMAMLGGAIGGTVGAEAVDYLQEKARRGKGNGKGDSPTAEVTSSQISPTTEVTVGGTTFTPESAITETRESGEVFAEEPDLDLDFSRIPPEQLGHFLQVVEEPGRYNGEVQVYTARAENVRIEEGELILEAHLEDYSLGGEDYEVTSGKVTTQGIGEFTYGRYEIEAQLPNGAGPWSAFWLYPAVGADGREIDIFEALGADNLSVPDLGPSSGRISSSVHPPNGDTSSNEIDVPDLYDNYHRFWVEATPTGMVFGIDDQAILRYSMDPNDPAGNPFIDEHGNPVPFFILLNNAMGGEWNDDILKTQGREYPSGIDPSQQDKWKFKIKYLRHYPYIGN